MDSQTLAQLVCPVTHSALCREGDFLVAERGGLKYPIKDGIPIMLIEEGDKWINTKVEDLPVPPPQN